jgi:HK97 family phage prohead protease
MATKWMSEAEFRKAPTPDAAIRKAFAAEVKAEAGKPVVLCIGSSAPDRMGDTIASTGWRLESYQKNPIVLWAHDRHQPPVAKSARVWADGERLMSEPEFTPREMYPFGAMVGEMVKGGFLNAASVGFRPLKHAWNEERGGIDFIEQELLEYSIVPVPANAEALVEAKAAGIDLLPLVEWLERSLDCVSEAGLVLPRASLEKAWAVVGRKAASVGKADEPAPSAPPADPPKPDDRIEQLAADVAKIAESIAALAERVTALEPDDEPDEPEEETPVPPAPEAEPEKPKAFDAGAIERAVADAIAANAKALGIS